MVGWCWWSVYGVFIKYCVFFQRILESLPPLLRQHTAAIGCTQNYQPIRVTVHSYCVVSYTVVGEGGVAVNCEKTHFFLNTLFHNYTSYGALFETAWQWFVAKP